MTDERKVPWTYWPIAAVGLLLAMVVGAAVGTIIGVNPYIGAAVGNGAYRDPRSVVVAMTDNTREGVQDRDTMLCPVCRGDGEADAGREAREAMGVPRHPCPHCDGTGVTDA